MAVKKKRPPFMAKLSHEYKQMGRDAIASVDFYLEALRNYLLEFEASIKEDYVREGLKPE